MFITTTPDVFYFVRRNISKSVSSLGVLPKFKGKMYPFWFENARITWTVDPTWVSPRYNLYRSESPGGPWTKVNAIPIEANVYNDLGTKMVSKYAHDYYFVEVIVDGHVLGKSDLIKNERDLETWHSLRAVEINRREWLMLTRFMGTEIIILRHVNYGKYFFRCTECWDAVNKVCRNDYCTTCYGTTYQMGYYKGIPSYAQFESMSKSDTKTEEGTIEPSSTSCWTIAYPEIEIGDIILRVKDYKAFRVSSSNNTELRNSPVRQILGVDLLPTSCVEYELFKREGVLVP